MKPLRFTLGRTAIRSAIRIVKPCRRFYNALTLAAVLALAVGCGQPPAPPAGAEEETPPADVELGAESTAPSQEPAPAQEPAQPTPSSPADGKRPAGESGAK